MPVVEGLRLGDMAKGGDPVPEAIYHVRIAKTEEKVSEPNDKNPDPYPYLAVTYVVTGGSPEEYHGRHIFENLTYAPGKNFALRQLAEAVGLSEDDDVLEAIRTGAFIDQELQIAVSIEKEREDKKTGKKYEARNNVRKRMQLAA